MRQPSRLQIVSLLIRRYPYGHPNPFRSVHDLGRAAGPLFTSVRRTGRSLVWLSAWLPAAHEIRRRDALLLLTSIGPSTGEGTAPCPAQTPPSNPTAAGPGDGRVRLQRNLTSSPAAPTHCRRGDVTSPSPGLLTWRLGYGLSQAC